MSSEERDVTRRSLIGGMVAGAAALGASGAAAAASPAPSPGAPGLSRSDGRFAGRVALITGAARGLGRAYAVGLAHEGATIVGCDILAPIGSVAYPLASMADLDETARLVANAGGRFLGVKADVRDPAAATALVEQAVRQFGKVDFLLANAGIYTTSPVASMSDAMFDDVIRTNLYGVFNIMRAALGPMQRQQYGRIVATASMAGRMGLADHGHYCASKWGVIGLVKSLALEVAKQNITVNAVCPTSMNTPLLSNEVNWRKALPNDPNPTREKFEAASRAKPYAPQGVPWVEPEDVTKATLFLLSDDARHITGTSIDVAAGGSAGITA